MLADTHTQRVLDLATQKGLLRASDLDAIDAPRVVLTRLTAAGGLERVGRGLYRLPDAHGSEFESLAIVATKVPQAVFCLLTALQFHELTTQLPRQIWIAMPRGSHVPRIDYPPVKMVQMTGDVYTAGVVEHLRDGVKPLTLTSSQAYACLHCGLLWHHLDPRQLIANTSRYGLAPHRTAAMEAAALKPQKLRPHS